MKKLFNNGLIIGKFMPFHKGHEFLISFGIAHCENLIVIVDHFENETINKFERVKWIEKTYPNITVKTFKSFMPQSPEETDAFWNIWKNEIESIIKPDVLFASEDYGIKLSEVLNCKFVPCDIERKFVNISATKIRNNFYSNFEFLNKEAKKYFLKEFVFVGPESTFKSTIAEKIKNKGIYINVVPEYAERYIKTNCIQNIDKDILDFFAISQKQWSNTIIEINNCPYIIHDSDILTTMVYYKTLFNEIPKYMFEILEENKNKEYFLFYPDNNYIEEEHRILNKEEIYRIEWFNCALEILKDNDFSYTIIKGDFKTKFEQVENIFSDKILKHIKKENNELS